MQVILDGHNKIAALAVGLGNGEVLSFLAPSLVPRLNLDSSAGGKRGGSCRVRQASERCAAEGRPERDGNAAAARGDARAAAQLSSIRLHPLKPCLGTKLTSYPTLP